MEPTEEAVDRLADMMVRPQAELLLSLCAQAVKEAPNVPVSTAAVVARFFRGADLDLALLKWAVTKELDTRGIQTSLFRGTTPAMRLLPHFYRAVAGDWLEDLLGPFLADFSAVPPLEDDLCGTLLPTEQQQQHSEVMEAGSPSGRFLSAVETLLDRIFASADDCPLAVRRLVRFARDETAKRFPEQAGTVVGLFVFLRLLAPAIATPEAYSLPGPQSSREQKDTDAASSSSSTAAAATTTATAAAAAADSDLAARRNLVLASRVVQWIANGAAGDLRVGTIPRKVLQELAARKLPAMTAFCDKIVAVSDPASPLTLPPRGDPDRPHFEFDDVCELHGVILLYQPAILRSIEKDFANPHLAAKLKFVVDTLSSRNTIHRRVSQRSLSPPQVSSPSGSSSSAVPPLKGIPASGSMSGSAPLSAPPAVSSPVTTHPVPSVETLDQATLAHLTAAASSIARTWHQRMMSEAHARQRAEAELAAKEQMHRRAIAELTGKLEQALAAKQAMSEQCQSLQLEVAALKQKLQQQHSGLSSPPTNPSEESTTTAPAPTPAGPQKSLLTATLQQPGPMQYASSDDDASPMGTPQPQRQRSGKIPVHGPPLPVAEKPRRDSASTALTSPRALPPQLPPSSIPSSSVPSPMSPIMAMLQNTGSRSPSPGIAGGEEDTLGRHSSFGRRRGSTFATPAAAAAASDPARQSPAHEVHVVQVSESPLATQHDPSFETASEDKAAKSRRSSRAAYKVKRRATQEPPELRRSRSIEALEEAGVPAAESAPSPLSPVKHGRHWIASLLKKKDKDKDKDKADSERS